MGNAAIINYLYLYKQLLCWYNRYNRLRCTQKPGNSSVKSNLKPFVATVYTDQVVAYMITYVDRLFSKVYRNVPTSDIYIVVFFLTVSHRHFSVHLHVPTLFTCWEINVSTYAKKKHTDKYYQIKKLILRGLTHLHPNIATHTTIS